MVLRAQWPLGTIAQFFHFVAEEKKDDKKTKAFYDWATSSIPVIIRQHSIVDWLLSTTPTDRIFFLMKSGLCFFFCFLITDAIRVW